jgi:hypothetical protein
MKVKCIRNDYGFDKFLTVGKVYEVITTLLTNKTYVLYHDKGKGMSPINYFEILKEK